MGSGCQYPLRTVDGSNETGSGSGQRLKSPSSERGWYLFLTKFTLIFLSLFLKNDKHSKEELGNPPSRKNKHFFQFYSNEI